MLFVCSPAQLVSYILEKLAFCGSNGISLKDMWLIVADKQGLPIDTFQKQIIWQWLFFYNDESSNVHLYILKDGKGLAILPAYDEFIDREGSEAEINIVPSFDTQWKYLTGLGNSKKLKVQLGDYPFQLLCEIAKHGSEGIYSPELCKTTGQDPRSLPLRLRKLEELQLIVKINAYNEKTKQHTNLCIHSKFVSNNVLGSILESEEDFEVSRNVYKLKQFIIESVKNAPNQLRGFRDLKSELKLDKNNSSSKFFRGIVEFLHTHGYVERLMVKDPNDLRLVYCIKYIKDIPKDSDEISDYVDFITTLDDQGGDDEDLDDLKLPLVNSIFPLSNQLYQRIGNSKGSGLTSMEINRILTGASDYRPFLKILDSLTSFILDDEKLKPLKKYADLYENHSIIRAYDFEGKYKFYRYFTRENQQLPVTKSLVNNKPAGQENLFLSIKDLNNKFYKPLSKIPKGALFSNKKRKIEPETTPIAKKPRPTLKEPKTKVGRRKIDQSSDKISESGFLRDSSKDKSRELKQLEAPLLEIGPIEPPTSIKPNQKKRTSTFSSLKANKRRLALLSIISDLGGVTYTTTKLCRLLDDKLGNSTVTDKKTLARDVSILIGSKDLEVQNISFVRLGQKVSRKLLILTDPKLRPSEKLIEAIKKECIEDNGTKINIQINRRVIEGEVKFYMSKNMLKSRKGRLESLGESKQKLNVKVHPLNISDPKHYDSSLLANDDADVKENNDPLKSLVSKKHKRSKRTKQNKSSKPSTPTITSKSSRRYRPVKFDTSDATMLFRSVVISKTFKKGLIDFEEIASLFSDMSAKEVKQKWTVVRKQIGGLAAVLKGTEAFEYIVMKGIDDGLVSTEDLEEINFEFFLDLWKDSDNSVIEIADKTPLYESVSQNLEKYSVTHSLEYNQDLYDQLEDNSMRQKEAILSNTCFYYKKCCSIKRKEYDDLRTILKAIFSTKEENFSPNQVTQLLKEFDESIIQKASAALIKDKEISYYSLDDSDSRFVLTDKVFNAITIKIFTPNFFKEAAWFKDIMTSILLDKKGLIVSQGIFSGHMCTLIYSLSSEIAKITRLDKAYKFNGYESRLIDKEKLACDIIVYGMKDLKFSSNIKKVEVPTGKACSHIWLDLNGNINSQLWLKIIISILYYIHFRPGIPCHMLQNKMHAILGYEDFNCVIEWLIKSNCIRKGEFNDLRVTNEWFSLLGC